MSDCLKSDGQCSSGCSSGCVGCDKESCLCGPKTIENKLEPGDVVVIKSGGPLMTLASQETMDGYYCQWIDKNENYHYEWFSKFAITKKFSAE